MEVGKFSSEIWLQTFSYLSKQNLKAIRFCGSRRLESLASSLLYTTAYVAARTGVLDTFVALATHPYFRNHVKKVVYDTSCFDPTVVNKYAKDPSGPALEALYQDQQSAQDQQLRVCLEKWLKCLGNIQEVHVADISRSALLPGDQNSALWDRNHLDALLLARIESQCQATNLSCPTLRITEDLPVLDADNGFLFECKGLFMFLRVLSKYSPATLRSLSLGSGYSAARNGGLSHHLFHTPDNNGMLRVLGPVCSSLRKLDLTVSFSHVREAKDRKCTVGCSKLFPGTKLMVCDKARMPAKMQPFLGSFENLEELRLVCNSPLLDLNLEDTLAGHTWPKLGKVYIQYFKGKASELEDFIYRHADTLRDTSINDFWLTSGSWEAFVMGLPTLAPKLKIEFGGLAFQGQTRKQLSYVDYHLKALSANDDVDAEGDILMQESTGRVEKDSGKDGPWWDSDSDFGDLAYDSDDSIHSTASDPGPDLTSECYDLMSSKVHRKIIWLQKKVPGHQLSVYYVALQDWKEDHEAARRALYQEYVVCPKLELKYPGFLQKMDAIQSELPFLIDAEVCISALVQTEGDVEGAFDVICETREVDTSRPNPKYKHPDRYI